MKQPRSRSEPLLTSWLLVRYGVTGLYVGAATIGIMVWWFSDHGVGLNAAAVLAEVTKGARAPLHGVFGRRERGGTAAPAGKTAPVTSLLTWTQCKEWASFAPRGCDLVHLGVADAKGGVAMILHALELLRDQQFDDYGTITVLFNPDEEMGSKGLVDQARLADEL